MMASNPLRQSRRYIATVVANDDSMKMGRVQVRINALHKDVPDEDLPWAIPQITSDRFGSTAIPHIGRRVYVTFQDKDGYELMYTGLVVDADKQKIPSPFTDRYPLRRGFWDRYGNFLYFDEHDGEIKLATAHGITLTLDKNGNFLLDITSVFGARFSDPALEHPDQGSEVGNMGINIGKGDMTTTVTEGDLTITVGGNILIQATGSVRINGARIDLN